MRIGLWAVIVSNFMTAILFSGGLFSTPAQEYLTVTVPIKADPSTTSLRPAGLCLDDEIDHISIRLKESSGNVYVSGGREVVFNYDGPVADTMINQLNTAPLNVKSLQRRIIERLCTDKLLTGCTFLGAPQ